MTTTSAPAATTPAAIATLAANLYQHAMELDEMPFVGTIPAYADLNEKLARDAVQQLHDFLIVVADQLDEEWTAMLATTASYETWCNAEA